MLHSMFSDYAFVVLLCVLQLAQADLPVHCLRHQVVGDWEFTLSPLQSKRSSCGHLKPDDPNSQPHMKYLESLGSLSKRKMTLRDPDTASDEDGASGTWTMIYDEGFEVAVGDFVYFAFSKFTFTDAARTHNVSHCDETQIGWYHNAERSKFGCYVAKMVNSHADQPESGVLQAAPIAALQSFGSAESEDTEDDKDDSSESSQDQGPEAPSPQKFATAKAQLTSWLDEKQDALAPDAPSDDSASSSPKSQAGDSNQNVDALLDTPADYKPWVPGSAGYDKPMAGSFQQSVAEALNFLQLGWTAQAYDQFHGKTPRELNKLAGVRRNRLHPNSRPKGLEAKEGFTSFLGVSHRVHRSSSDEESLDWRIKDGHNWLSPVVTQGDCGSCYTISTVHMLQARNKIRSGNPHGPKFSVSFPLYCSEYNQGCDGGYGFLQSKWNEDVGLVPEHCAPFSQGGGSCKISSDCNLGGKRYRATGHHYVGGYYGGADPDSIRKELVEHGPMVMSFEPQEDFMYYKNGVYKSSPNKIHQEWEQVDHAVLLVGFGSAKTDAYWTMQNSWGSDWGEDGYFRMKRGTDESGCESIVVAAQVVEEDSNPILDDFLASM
jgi:cathepsin C